MTAKEIPEHNRWALDLKVGDTVFIETRFNIYKDTVTKITATQIAIGGNYHKFSKSTLSRKLDSWTYEYIRQVTPERLAQHNHAGLLSKVRNKAILEVEKRMRTETLEKLTVEDLQKVMSHLTSICGKR